MSKSRGSAPWGRRLAVVVAAATTCGAILIGSAGTASAGNLIVCGGKVAALGKNADTEAKYFIQCSEDIRGYAVVSSQRFDFFGTETDVVPTTSQSATLQCEGTVPGWGFGCGTTNRNTAPSGTPANTCGSSPTANKCTNRVSAGNTISGEVHFEKSPCLAKNKPKIWVTATSDPFVTSVSTATPPGPDTNTTGEYSSQPWQLKVTGFRGKKCDKTVKADEKASNKNSKK